jgi:hypothetical protein
LTAFVFVFDFIFCLWLILRINTKEQELGTGEI